MNAIAHEATYERAEPLLPNEGVVKVELDPGDVVVANASEATVAGPEPDAVEQLLEFVPDAERRKFWRWYNASGSQRPKVTAMLVTECDRPGRDQILGVLVTRPEIRMSSKVTLARSARLILLDRQVNDTRMPREVRGPAKKILTLSDGQYSSIRVKNRHGVADFKVSLLADGNYRVERPELDQDDRDHLALTYPGGSRSYQPAPLAVRLVEAAQEPQMQREAPPPKRKSRVAAWLGAVAAVLSI